MQSTSLDKMSGELYASPNTMSDENTDILIVGAGPGGLATALTLGSYGIETLLVERRVTPSQLPRANTLSTGTMELLRRWGVFF